MRSFSLDREILAPPATVFEVLTDHRGYVAITPLRSAELEREGDPPPNGVGAIRVLKALGPPIREEVVEYQPNERFVYRVLSGLPVRDHLGTVQLTESPRGTYVHYRIEATPTVPLAGRAVVGIVKLSVASLLRGVTREAQRRAAATSAV
jgi:uncharacterized protein YndB with AHSA1/START domain